MKRLSFACAVIILFSLSVFAQIPRPVSTPPNTENEIKPGGNASSTLPRPIDTPPAEEDVVKISTALIQLDVVVTDKNGRLVTDLKPEDFEITENGERQTITNLSYFSGQKLSVADANLTSVGNVNSAMPTIGEVRRTVAVVVDDAGLSAQSINLVKKELIRFINEQVQPNDLVAIIKTSGSVGVLQQFTTDKKKLLETIENLRYQPITGSGLSPFAPISISFAEQIQTNMGGGELSDKSKAILEQRTNVEFLNNLNKNLVVTAGALGVLNSTIAAMSRMPGRKSVLYVAEGVFSLFDSVNSGSMNNRNAKGGSLAGLVNSGGASSIFADSRELEEKLRGITEIANRATIAVYTLDPRGTATINFSAADQMRGGITDRDGGGLNESDMAARSNSFRASQLGLKFLSDETSGKAFINTNDIGKGLRETLDSQNGYYVLAYQPDTETFDAGKRRFNKLNIKVKRPNVNVSYRSGFFNVAETAEEKTAETPERVFLQRLFSPYKYSDVDLKIASIYAADEQATTVRSFISIEPRSLQFVDSADGADKTAQFDVVAVAFNQDGIPISQVGKRFDIKVSQKGYEKLLADGIASSLSFATKTKGAQQVKVAVRDVNTNRIGTAAQTVEVPDFDKDSLGLSGILLQNNTMAEWQNAQSGKSSISPADVANRMQTNTARRQFKKGTVLSFNYAIYSAPSFRSKAQTVFTVFKDGQQVFSGKAEELNIASAGKMQRINRGGAFLLGTDMASGKYVLQVSVSGDGIKEAKIQQIDFELTN